MSTNNLGEALLAPSPQEEATAAGGSVGEEDEPEVDRKGLIISFLSLALSIPALIGA